MAEINWLLSLSLNNFKKKEYFLVHSCASVSKQAYSYSFLLFSSRDVAKAVNFDPGM